MPQPASREEFKDYILRKIGAPVIQVNVSEEQIEDRVDEAVSFWRDYHYNGSQIVYLKHELTQNDVDNGYIKLPPNILGISKVFDLNQNRNFVKFISSRHLVNIFLCHQYIIMKRMKRIIIYFMEIHQSKN